MTRTERLAKYFQRLGEQVPSTSAEEALSRVITTLDEVEDAFSGIPKSDPPPPIGQSDGRMYPPLDDSVTPRVDGGIFAKSKGHDIEIGPDGSILIRNRAGQIEFQQSGRRS